MDDRGFTIIELVLVIIVAAVIAAVAVPQFARYWAGIKTSNAAMKIASDIRYAQNRATTTQQRNQVNFAGDGKSYTINSCATYTSACACTSGWTPVKTISFTSGEFLYVTVSSTVNPLEFDSLGRPYSTGVCYPAASAGATITASYSDSTKTIMVTTQTGMVQVN